VGEVFAGVAGASKMDVGVPRGQFLISPLRAKCFPRGEVGPQGRGEVGPQGRGEVGSQWRPSVSTSVFVTGRLCSPLGVNEGANIPNTQNKNSSLGETHVVKNRPLWQFLISPSKTFAPPAIRTKGL
jgi:hypothetical protein